MGVSFSNIININTRIDLMKSKLESKIKRNSENFPINNAIINGSFFIGTYGDILEILSPVTQTKDGFLTKEDKIIIDGLDNRFDSKADKVHGNHVPEYITEPNDTKYLHSSGIWKVITAFDVGVYNKDEVYTKAEVNNLLSSLMQAIDWKEAVATFDDLATTYPNAENGWTVNVLETNKTYTYNNGNWVLTGAKDPPIVTSEINGLMSKEDKVKLDGIEPSANHYVHPDSHSADMITENDNKMFVTKSEKESWNNLVSSGGGLPPLEPANNAKFLRCDGTWQIVSPGNIGAYSKEETLSKNEIASGYVPVVGDTIVDGVLTVRNIGYISDINKKRDITQITNALNKVRQLKGVDFRYIDSDEWYTGLIAQDVKKVNPYSIRSCKDDTLIVDYPSLIGLLVEAIKELEFRVSELEMRGVE